MIEHNPTYIYSPSKTYGGVEVLFERYIRWGHKHGCKYIIVDSVGGSFSKRLSDICEACDINQPPPTRSGVFITTSGHILNGLAWAAPSPKLKPLIWIVHPHEWISTAIPFFYFVLNKFGYTAAKIYLTLHYTQIKRIKNIWATLDKKGSLVCMDGACLRSGKYFIDQNLAPPLLPIPSPIMLSSPMPIRCKKFEDILCIGYFGRIDLHKSNAIYTFVHDLMKVNRGRAKNLKLIIVGEGYYTQSVESLCKSFSIEIDLCGAMKNDDGRAFLASSCDLGIAMGTAALGSVLDLEFI